MTLAKKEHSINGEFVSMGKICSELIEVSLCSLIDKGFWPFNVYHDSGPNGKVRTFRIIAAPKYFFKKFVTSLKIEKLSIQCRSAVFN